MSVKQLTKHRTANVRKLFRAPQHSMKTAICFASFLLAISLRLDASPMLALIMGGIILAVVSDEFLLKRRSIFLTPINPYGERTPRGMFYVLTFWNSFNYLFTIILLIKIFSLASGNPAVLPICFVLQLPASILAAVLIVRHVRWYWLWKAMDIRMAGMGLRRTMQLQTKGPRSSD